MSLMIRSLMATVGAMLFVGVHALNVSAEELLVFGDAQFLGVALPSKDEAETFKLCNGAQVNPEYGEIRETAQRCAAATVIGIVMENEDAVEQAKWAIEQGNPVAAREIVFEAEQRVREALQETRKHGESVEFLEQELKFYAAQQQSLQRAVVALRQQDLQTSTEALQQAQQGIRDYKELDAPVLLRAR